MISPLDLARELGCVVRRQTYLPDLWRGALDKIIVVNTLPTPVSPFLRSTCHSSAYLERGNLQLLAFFLRFHGEDQQAVDLVLEEGRAQRTSAAQACIALTCARM